MIARMRTTMSDESIVTRLALLVSFLIPIIGFVILIIVSLAAYRNAKSNDERQKSGISSDASKTGNRKAVQ
jgi:sensor domain CHASE-containing protein